MAPFPTFDTPCLTSDTLAVGILLDTVPEPAGQDSLLAAGIRQQDAITNDNESYR
jgi:hypothetical protein